MACLFCRIVEGEIPSEKVYEDDDVLVIKDIQPQAPTHLLCLSKLHVESLAGLADERLAGKLLCAAARVAGEAGLVEGWRLIGNTGVHGGQEVPHLHLHVLGGRPLGRMLPSSGS